MGAGERVHMMMHDDVTAEIRRAEPAQRPVVAGRRRCAWCRRILPERSGPGRPRKYCNQSCRQWDWVHRQRADELELSDNELIVTRDALDRLRDDLYVLTCAIDDTERDLAAANPSSAELRATLEWLLDAARTAISTDLTPLTP